MCITTESKNGLSCRKERVFKGYHGCRVPVFSAKICRQANKKIQNMAVFYVHIGFMIMDSLFRKLKAAWIVFWWASASVVLWVPITLSGFFSKTGNLAFRFCQLWVWVGKSIAFLTFEKKGNVNVDPSKSYVVISNHQSFFDIPALMLSLGIQFRWVIKKEFIYVPLFGWALYMAKHVFIDRSQPKKSIKSMNDAVKRLPKGVSVTVFAEGTRSDDGSLKEFKSGGFLTAIAAGLPILPVTINGSWRTMPNKRSLSFHPGKIQVVIGDPIETTGYSRQNLTELVDKTRDAVMSNLNPEYPK